MGNKISMYHIGGRNGDGKPLFPNKFNDDISNIFIDADPDCTEHIKASYSGNGANVQVLPYCLSDARKTVSFNINYDPFTSSIYRINPEYGSYYTFMGGRDYIINDVTKTVETRQVETVTIDQLVKEDKTVTPDILSIDTQGSEYDILMGAKESLKSTLVVIAETVFNPIYENKIVFGDLVKLLGEQGFHFARFLTMDEASPFRGSIGLRGLGFHMSSDAMFIRRIETIEDDLMLWKLAFISIALNQFEYGIACLRKSKGLAKTDGEPTYIRFIRELENSLTKMQEVFPYRFPDFYKTFEASNGRFKVDYKAPAIKLDVKPLTDSVITQGFSESEMALNRYGLENQANLLRKNRTINMRSVMRSEQFN